MRFPILRTYRGIFIFLAGLSLIGGFGAGLYASYSFTAYSFAYRSDGSILFNPLWQISLPSFLGPYLLGVLAAVGFLVTAEVLKLVLNLEDHLYHLRNVDRPLAELRRAKRREDARAQINQAMRRGAVNFGEMVAGQVERAAATTKTRLQKVTTDGSSGRLNAPSAPPTRRSLPPAPPVEDDDDLSDLFANDPPPPTPSIPRDPEAARRAFNQGVQFGRKGQTTGSREALRQAVAAFEEAVRHDPDFADAWRGLASAYKLVGNTPEAERALAEYNRLKMSG